MDKYKKSIIAVLLFFLIQIVCSIVLFIGGAILSLLHDVRMTTVSVSIQESLKYAVLIASYIWGCMRSRKLGIINPETIVSLENTNLKLSVIAVVSALSVMTVANTILWEFIQLPNWLEQDFLDASNNVCGIIVIAVVGPFAEELLMREGVLGNMVRKGVKPSAAVAISAIVFGIIHFNPAQTFPAIISGIVLGILYLKTGSIVVPFIVHVINNSICVICMNVYGTECLNRTTSDVVGVPMAIIIMVVAAISGIWGLRYVWNKNPFVVARTEDK